MTEAFSGSYPIESRGGEIERLHIQSAAMVPDTERMLELIGVREGWSCLDIGCGPGGIVGLLSKRVGSTGRVVGLDMNIGFLEHARATAPSKVEFVVADAYGSNLPAGTFDLVHMRFVASTSGAPERLLQEAKRLKAKNKIHWQHCFRVCGLGDVPARATDTPTKPRILSLLQVRAFKAHYAEGSAAVIDLYQRPRGAECPPLDQSGQSRVLPRDCLSANGPKRTFCSPQQPYFSVPT